jgi:hypothetical protein
MLTALQLNKQPSRQSLNRPPPPPPLSLQSAALPAAIPQSNIHDRLDFQVARILDDPPPRIQTVQPLHYPPSSAPHVNPSRIEQTKAQQHRRVSHDNKNDSSSTFFNKFGIYDDKRTQLNDDLKREYNEYLQSQRGVPKSKSTSQLVSSQTTNNNRHVRFESNGNVVPPWEKHENKTTAIVRSVQDLSLTTNEHTNNRSHGQVVRHADEQYIRDREAYINELHAQIRELEGRRQDLEKRTLN